MASQTVLVLPLQNPAFLDQNLSSNGSIAHELAHVFEPSALIPQGMEESSHFYGVKSGLATWSEARAFLIDYMLTGNISAADENGVVYTNIESPTINSLEDAAPAFEEHLVGQFLAHVLFRLSQNKQEQWISTMIQAIDENLSSQTPLSRVNHRLDLDAIDLGINPNVREENREAFTNGRRARIESQLRALEHILSALLATLQEQPEFSSADFAAVTNLLTDYGFEINL